MLQNQENIYRQVLFVGPDCRNHRGGIGAVIESYGRHLRPFRFISTYRPLSPLLSVLYSAAQMLRLFIYLLAHPTVKLLHIHGASRGSFFRKYIVFLMARYLFGKKIIYHIHGGEFHIFSAESSALTRKMIRHFINRADAVICLSSRWQQFFADNFRPRRLEIVRNFIEVPAPLQSSAASKEKQIFLFLGKVEKNKGIYDLVEVIRELRDKGIGGFELRVGGNGEVEQLAKLIREYSLEDFIRFMGWISGEEKQSVLQEADLYILPSYNEGMPVSILEAMAHAVPVISTYTGGIPELVSEGESGLLIEPGNRKALAVAMTDALQHPDKWKAMGERGREIVSAHFSAESTLAQITRLYTGLLMQENPVGGQETKGAGRAGLQAKHES